MKNNIFLILIFLIFQFSIIIGYGNFINLGAKFNISLLFDEEFVIMIAIFLVSAIFFEILSNFIFEFLKERVNFLESSFLNSYNLFLEQLLISKNLLKGLILSLNNNLYILIKLNQNFFNFFILIEQKLMLVQSFYFQTFYIFSLSNIKKLF